MADKEGKTSYVVNPDEGLDYSSVKARIKNGQTNKKVSDNEYSTGAIIRKNVFTYFNFVFFAFALVLIIEGSFNQLAFLGVVFTNTVIGIIQEIRSRRALDKLNLLSERRTKVIRGGMALDIKGEELVLDDIVELESGNQVPADAVLRKGEVYVNESLLTGEADEVRKSCGDKLLSGSFIVSGKCRAQLSAVGGDSFAGALTKEAKRQKKGKRPGMMRSLNILIIAIGVIIIPFSIIMFCNQHFSLGLSIKESVENTVASAIGMIPEGLYLLTSIALAASTVRLARSKTIVHDMKCIESLARADVICVDKTGTITEPEMKLSEISPLSEDFSEDKLSELAFGMETENITLCAIKNYFEEKNTVSDKKPLKKKEFSSKFKYSAARLSDDAVYLLGAPEILLNDDFENYEAEAQKYLASGERVLLFAKAENGDRAFADERFTGVVKPLAFIALSNPIRENAREIFEYFSSQGVDVKVISGDNPETVASVAERAGIKNAQSYIDLSGLSDDEVMSSEILRYTVFGRVSPTQKRLLVRNLKKNGHTVAMTGDGVNDVLALKDADCSIAMASGSEAASSVSDLVLVNSDFANMPKVVDEGRRVINNIERTASLFLVKNIFSFILTLVAMITVSVYPLKPIQISLSSGLMIGIPSFLLALEENHNLVKGRFLTNVLRNAFPVGITSCVLVSFAMLIADEFNMDYATLSTVSCFVFSFAGYTMLYKVCKPMNVRHGIMFAAMGIIYVASVAVLPEFFNISRLNAGSLIITILLIAQVYPLQTYIERLFGVFKRKKEE